MSCDAASVKMRICLRSASGSARATQPAISSPAENDSFFSSTWPAESRSMLRNISIIRPSRFDSELISSAICLRFSSGSA